MSLFYDRNSVLSFRSICNELCNGERHFAGYITHLQWFYVVTDNALCATQCDANTASLGCKPRKFIIAVGSNGAANNDDRWDVFYCRRQ